MAAIFRPLRFARDVAVLGVCAMLASCGSVAETFGIRDPFAVQRPYEGTNRNWAALTSIIGERAVFVTPVENLPPALAADLAERIADALRNRDILASSKLQPEESLILHGQSEAAKDANGEPVLRFVFTLEDGHGQTLSELVRDVPTVPGSSSEEILAALDGKTLNVIAAAAADESATAMGRLGQGSPATPSDTARVAPPRVRIAAINGGPGEAGPLLARSAAVGLTRRGVVIVEDGEAPDYILTATIVVSGDDPVMRLVTITWTLSDSRNAPLGDVAQSNPMAIREIEGRWAETAALAGDAAAEGIVELLRQLAATAR